MALYHSQNGKIQKIRNKGFRLEKDLQELVETNLEALLGLQMVKSEFSVENYRIDTLAYDPETKAFIIIEYKRNQNFSVIDQGYAYLAVMLNNKADFILEFNERMDKTLRRSDVDWSQSRVLFVGPSFTNYQRDSINFKDLPIELYEAKTYEGGIFHFEVISKTKATESIATVSTGSQTAEKVKREVKVYNEADHLESANEDIRAIYEELKERVLALGEMEVVPRKMYIGFKASRNVVETHFQKSALKVWICVPSGELKDPLNLTRDVSQVGHFGTGDYELSLKSAEQLDEVMYLVKQSYQRNK